ncbi:DUF1259 domain-containing protein [Paenibacillus sp. P26]|nr:DUF1259 domain-containing protein [Paenibacillus sp. P26]UUZ93988.1 DUF1259 domain-containing protein [Paenibacillus sp. P25]
MAEHTKVSPQFKKLCTQFGKILGGESEIDQGPVCFVTRMTNLRATILGRRTRSPLVQMQMFSFESLDKSGRALCLYETAVHNHWLKENPRLMYMHWEATMNPVVFARRTKESIAFLG